MTTINHSQLEQMLLSFGKAQAGQFISLDSRTKVTATVKSRLDKSPFFDLFGTKTVYKIASRRFQIGLEYERVVNNRREREGMDKSFESAGTYGDLENAYLLRLKDGQWQMRVYNIAQPDNAIFVREDGSEITGELLERLKVEFMPVPSQSVKQGLGDSEVMPLNFKPESIVRMTVAGEKYEVMA